MQADAINEVRKKKVQKKQQNTAATADVRAGKQDWEKRSIMHNVNKTPTMLHVILLIASIVWRPNPSTAEASSNVQNPSVNTQIYTAIEWRR